MGLNTCTATPRFLFCFISFGKTNLRLSCLWDKSFTKGALQTILIEICWPRLAWNLTNDRVFSKEAFTTMWLTEMAGRYRKALSLPCCLLHALLSVSLGTTWLRLFYCGRGKGWIMRLIIKWVTFSSVVKQRELLKSECNWTGTFILADLEREKKMDRVKKQNEVINRYHEI